MGTTTKKANIIEFLEREYVVPDSRQLINFTRWEWQRQILSDLFMTMNGDKRMYTGAIITTPRQQGKSLILQCIGLYMLVCCGYGLNIYSIACDKDQAALVPERVKKAISFNPNLSENLKITRDVMTNPTNGNTWTILTSDKASAPGITADVLLWDELAQLPEYQWNLVYLLLPSQSARKQPLMIIASTVGESEDGPLNDFMKIGRDQDDLHTYLYETGELLSPLTNLDQIERDRKIMPPAVFARHYQNLIIRGATFLTDDDIEAIVAPEWERPSTGRAGNFVGCDWGLTKDKCAISKITKAADDLYIVDKIKIFRGSKDDPVDLNEAADTVEEMRNKTTKMVLFDKWQAVATIQRFQKKWGKDKVDGYNFTGTGRKRLFQNLLPIIKNGWLRIYSDVLQDCWKESCVTCSSNLVCQEQSLHEVLRELQGLQCDADFNVTHGTRGDDATVSVALALMPAAEGSTPNKREYKGHIL